MVRGHLKGVNTVKKRLADGTIAAYYYHRETGTRLNGEPLSTQFLADVARAEALVRAKYAGQFNALIRDYTGGPEFERTLAESTQYEYKPMLTKAETKFGDMPIAALEDPRVRRDFLDWRAEVLKISGEREADNRLSAISTMLHGRARMVASQ